jgi:DNA-binding Lrp family transcriptional regulator
MRKLDHVDRNIRGIMQADVSPAVSKIAARVSLSQNAMLAALRLTNQTRN